MTFILLAFLISSPGGLDRMKPDFLAFLWESAFLPVIVFSGTVMGLLAWWFQGGLQERWDRSHHVRAAYVPFRVYPRAGAVQRRRGGDRRRIIQVRGETERRVLPERRIAA